jgi:hypothetical protein
MAEEGFIENIGELTNENFNSKMEEFKEKFKDYDEKENQIQFDNEKKTVTIGNKEFNVGFLKEKEDFITEKLKDQKGVPDQEFEIQATEDLKKLGIEKPVDSQIKSLSESYKLEYGRRLSLQPMPTELVENYFKDIPEQQSEILIGEEIPVLDPQQRQEALEKPERKEALDKAVKGITEKNPKLEKGFKKIGEMTIEEFNDALDKRQKETTNIQEKGICERMKEWIKEKYEGIKTIGLYMLLAFLGYEFLNAEMVAGSGCMVTVSNTNTNCRAMGYTLINLENTTNACPFKDGNLCQNPVVMNKSNPPVGCQPNYKEGNPIKIGNDAVCSEFCNSNYLIEKIDTNSANYNCVKCDINCAFRRVFQVICNVASDLYSGANDLWEFLKKWGFYIIIIVAVIIVIYLITKVIQGAREIKHVLYDTETGQTKTISSHDDLATLLSNKEITIKSPVVRPTPSFSALKFRLKK